MNEITELAITRALRSFTVTEALLDAIDGQLKQLPPPRLPTHPSILHAFARCRQAATSLPPHNTVIPTALWDALEKAFTANQAPQ